MEVNLSTPQESTPHFLPYPSVNPQKTSARKASLANSYEFKNLGPASTFVGLRITRDHPNRRLFIDQMPYAAEILGEFLMIDTTPVTIPINPKEDWGRRDGDVLLAEITTYQRPISKLMYLILGPTLTYLTPT